MSNKETKKWSIKTLEGKKVDFFPVFVANEKGDAECIKVILKIDGENYTFPYLEILMFCYMIGNEEQRRKLTNIQFKKVTYLPYNVSFKISEQEKKEGMARRRIELPVDNIIASYFKGEAQKAIFKKQLQHKL